MTGTSEFQVDMQFGDEHTVLTEEAIEGLVGQRTAMNVSGQKYPAMIVAAEPSFRPNYARVTLSVRNISFREGVQPDDV